MDHTLSAVDQDLSDLSRDVAAMGDLTVAQVRAALDVFLRHDLKTAEKVIRGDDALDLQEAEIEKKAIRFIALRQPFADDLRRSIAAMKVATQLERCGDLGKNIAKRVGRMDRSADEAQAKAIGDLGRMAVERLQSVVSAYREGSAEGAYAVWLKDTEIDERHDDVLRGLVAFMVGDPQSVGDSTHLLFIAKNLERIGDHATNIAELVHYQLTGTELSDRPKL